MMMHHAMNQLCKVCGEPAAGFHFGAFTCEGCKSFFGRTYNNLSSLSECKNNGRCVINKKNRTSCKSCRLRKCLMVGMSKSGSRYGRRSNWFKIHCLLQDQAALNGFPPMSGGPKMGYEADECGGMTPGGRDSPPNSHGHSKMSDGEMGGAESPDSREDSASPPTPSHHHHHHHHLNHVRSSNMILAPGTMLGHGGPRGGGLPSPFSPAYDSPSPPSSASSASDQGTKREFLPPPPQLPISPISPLSPMHQPKFLFGPTGYLNGPGSLYPKYLGAYRPYLPFLGAGGPGGLSGPFDHLFASTKSSPANRVVTLLAPPDHQDGTPPEQEDPIDLSVKKSPPGPRGVVPSRSPSPSSVDDDGSMRGRSGCGSEGHSEPGSPIRPDSPLDLTTSTPLPAVSSPCPRA